MGETTGRLASLQEHLFGRRRARCRCERGFDTLLAAAAHYRIAVGHHTRHGVPTASHTPSRRYRPYEDPTAFVLDATIRAFHGRVHASTIPAPHPECLTTAADWWMTRQVYVPLGEESFRGIEHTARTHRVTIAEWARKTRCRVRSSPLERAKPSDNARIRREENGQLVDSCEHLTMDADKHACMRRRVR